MEISEIRIQLHDGDKLRAFASVTLSHAFVIRGIKIIEGNQRTFVAMPSRPTPDGKQSDICHPVDRPTRDWFEQAILAEYDRVLHEGQGKARQEVAEGSLPL